jgi:hypothetical protein
MLELSYICFSMIVLSKGVMCDASILINSTNMDQAEKDVTINFSFGNFLN